MHASYTSLQFGILIFNWVYCPLRLLLLSRSDVRDRQELPPVGSITSALLVGHAAAVLGTFIRSSYQKHLSTTKRRPAHQPRYTSFLTLGKR